MNLYRNPYENLNNGRWLKTNFHIHAGTGPGTCGANPIPVVLDLYRQLKFDALCISNHDMYTDTSSFGDEKLFLVQGVEYTNNPNPHMLTIGVSRTLHELPHQEAINETLKMGGFTILCHPNWKYRGFFSDEQIDALTGYAGVEIINMCVYRDTGSGLATDTWDHLLKQGKLVYGFGSDDLHWLTDADRSSTYIYAKSRDYAGIKDAVDCGRLFASTGIVLEYLELAESTIKVKAKFPNDTYINKFIYRFVSGNGTVKESFGEYAEYIITNEDYVRAEVIAENGAMLFTQPVYKTDFFKKA